MQNQFANRNMLEAYQRCLKWHWKQETPRAIASCTQQIETYLGRKGYEIFLRLWIELLASIRETDALNEVKMFLDSLVEYKRSINLQALSGIVAYENDQLNIAKFIADNLPTSSLYAWELHFLLAARKHEITRCETLLKKFDPLKGQDYPVGRSVLCNLLIVGPNIKNISPSFIPQLVGSFSHMLHEFRMLTNINNQMFVEALRSADILVQLYPLNLSYRFSAGWLNYVLGKNKEATSYLEEVLKQHPEDIDAQKLLVKIHQKQGKQLESDDLLGSVAEYQNEEQGSQHVWILELSATDAFSYLSLENSQKEINFVLHDQLELGDLIILSHEVSPGDEEQHWNLLAMLQIVKKETKSFKNYLRYGLKINLTYSHSIYIPKHPFKTMLTERQFPLLSSSCLYSLNEDDFDLLILKVRDQLNRDKSNNHKNLDFNKLEQVS